MARRLTAKKARKRIQFLTDSPFATVRREVTQDASLRRKLIEKIEKHYRAKVILYFTSFRDITAEITDDDAEMIESILAVEHQGGKVLLILNSPGGQALAAERIVNVFRAYSDNKYEVLVPHMAKSAATMICLGASKIHMSKTAELGPVDPQVTFKDDAGRIVWISAEEYVRSYQKLIDQATGGAAQRIEPFIQQLNRYDARYIEKLLSWQELSKNISVSILKSGMMPSLSVEEIVKKIEVFVSQIQTSVHGRMINHTRAKACGLNIELIDLRSGLWNAVWELYVRCDWSVTNVCKKIIESRATALHAK